jgi:hypothetical protein
MFLAIVSYVLGITMEALIPSWGWFRSLNPVCTGRSPSSGLFTRREKGPIQQERECIHSHHGKRGREFSSGNRGSSSAAVVLQHHAKRSRIHLPPLLKPVSWLRYRGLDEAYVYQPSLTDMCPT